MVDPPSNNELDMLHQANECLLNQNEDLVLIRTQNLWKAQPTQDDPQHGEHHSQNLLKEIIEDNDLSHSANNVHRRAKPHEVQSHIRGVYRDRHAPGSPQQNGKDQFWERRFKEIQQELSHMKEAVKSKAPMTMNALVQQIESPFTSKVLRFPLPQKFKMPQIEHLMEQKIPWTTSTRTRIR